MKHSLVVVDSRVIRKVACLILESLRFEAEEAGDGIEALVACQSKMPDVILLDGNIPNMGGVEFLKALRRERDGDVPVIVYCTTENDSQEISTALGAGANEFVIKPFDTTVIRNKLHEFGLL